MPWLEKRRTKRGVSYHLRRVTPDGRTVTEKIGVVSAREAEKRLRHKERELLDSALAYADPKSRQMTLEQFARDKWTPRRDVEKSTADRDETLLRLYILPALGSKALRAVTRDSVEEFVVDLRNRLNPTTGQPKRATAKKALDLLKNILTRAEELDLVTRNPARGVSVDYESTPPAEISVENLYRIIEATPEWWKPVLVVAALSGLRKSELFAVARADVDWQTETIRVSKQLTATEGIKDHTKTRTSRRLVDMLSPVKEALQDVFLRNVDAGPDTLVFTTLTGAPIQHRNFDRRVWIPLMKRAGLWVPDTRDPERGRPLYTFHDLRHTFGSLLLHFTGDLAYVAEQLGHSGLEMLSRVYAHTLKEARKGKRLDREATLARIVHAYQARTTLPDEEQVSAPTSQASPRLP